GTATADPELEPDGLRSRAHGFLVWPPRAPHPLDECVERKFANPLGFVLPGMTAPAVRSRSTRNASFGAGPPASASDPAFVSIRSPVATLSLITTGTP